MRTLGRFSQLKGDLCWLHTRWVGAYQVNLLGAYHSVTQLHIPVRLFERSVCTLGGSWIVSALLMLRIGYHNVLME